MKTEAVFNNIGNRICDEIKKANKSIYIAVSWFTNKKIYDELLTKAVNGCSVNIIISDDKINEDSFIDFEKLEGYSGKIYKIGNGDTELMHNKFCVIDHNLVITGSYNWSYKAEKNYENIVINYDNSILGEQFIQQFYFLVQQFYLENKTDDFLKLKVSNNDRHIVRDIFKKNPKLLVDLISKYYPVNEFLMDDKLTFWNWDIICDNPNINWTVDLIKKNEDDIYFLGENYEGEFVGIYKNLSVINNFEIIDYIIGKVDQSYCHWFFDFRNHLIFEQVIKKYESYFNEKPLSFEVIEWPIEYVKKYSKFINWDYISRIGNLNEDFIEIFKNEIKWEILSRNNTIAWNVKLIKRYENNWNWKNLMTNDGIKWSKKFVDSFYDKIDFNNSSIYSNINFNTDFIERFHTQINWEYASQFSKMKLDFIRKNKKLIDWVYLSNNYKIKLNKKFIFEFQSRLYWHLFKNNDNIKWDHDLLARFGEFIDFDTINEDYDPIEDLSNSIEFSEYNFYNKIYPLTWYDLSSNSIATGRNYYKNYYSIKWSEDLVYWFEDKLNWRNLSGNENLPWNLSFFEKYLDRWNWKNLSTNPKLPWTTAFIYKYENLWDWDALSENTFLPWSDELVELFDNKWNFEYLSENKNVKWTLNLIQKYSEKLECSENLWHVIKPYVDNEIISETLEKIKNKTLDF